MVLGRAASVTIEALSRMMSTRGVGRLHPVLEPMAAWRDPDGDNLANTAMWSEFESAGWLDQRGGLDGDVLDTLAVLGRPSVEYFAIFTEKNKRYSALVADGPGETVIAFRDGDVVELTTVHDESLPATLMRQLSDLPPARIDALNVRVDQLTAAAGPDADDTWMNSGSRSVEEARKLAVIARQPLIGQGELYAGIRDQVGRYRVTDNPVRYHDLRSGRVLVSCSPGYLSVAPATKKLLLAHLVDAHAMLVG